MYLFVVHKSDAGGLQASPRDFPLEVEATLPVGEHERPVAHHGRQWTDLYRNLKTIIGVID